MLRFSPRQRVKQKNFENEYAKDWDGYDHGADTADEDDEGGWIEIKTDRIYESITDQITDMFGITQNTKGNSNNNYNSNGNGVGQGGGGVGGGGGAGGGGGPLGELAVCFGSTGSRVQIPSVARWCICKFKMQIGMIFFTQLSIYSTRSDVCDEEITCCYKIG